MRPNSLKLVRFNEEKKAVRARSLNPVNSAKKSADFKKINGVSSTPSTSVAALGWPAIPIDRKKRRLEEHERRDCRADEDRFQRYLTGQPDGQEEAEQK